MPRQAQWGLTRYHIHPVLTNRYSACSRFLYEVLYFFAIGRQERARKKWAAPTPGEDEAGEEAKIETELTPVEEGKSDKFEEQRPSEAPPEASERSQRPGLILQSVRSWRSGPDGQVVSYHELQRPQLTFRTKSEYAMRPSEDNIRNRTRFFRSR